MLSLVVFSYWYMELLSNLINLFIFNWYQAKYNVLSGNYPITTNDAITLGGILAYIENGPFNLELHTPGVFK